MTNNPSNNFTNNGVYRFYASRQFLVQSIMDDLTDYTDERLLTAALERRNVTRIRHQYLEIINLGLLAYGKINSPTLKCIKRKGYVGD